MIHQGRDGPVKWQLATMSESKWRGVVVGWRLAFPVWSVVVVVDGRSCKVILQYNTFIVYCIQLPRNRSSMSVNPNTISSQLTAYLGIISFSIHLLPSPEQTITIRRHTSTAPRHHYLHQVRIIATEFSRLVRALYLQYEPIRGRGE